MTQPGKQRGLEAGWKESSGSFQQLIKFHWSFSVKQDFPETSRVPRFFFSAFPSLTRYPALGCNALLRFRGLRGLHRLSKLLKARLDNVSFAIPVENLLPLKHFG